MNRKSFVAFVVVSLILVAAIFALVLSMGEKETVQETKVGLVLPGSVNETGWNGDHYRGVLDASKELGFDLMLAENAKEFTGSCERSVDSLVQAGAKLVILGSFNYPQEIESYIQNHPDVMFFGVSSGLALKNFNVYSARVYQARFMAGVIAALVSKNGKLGYVAAMNNSEVNRGINAFALGARKVNPKAKVFVRWTNSWDDVAVETSNVERLVKDAGIDVVAYHQNKTAVVEAAIAQGISVVGYNLMGQSFAPNVVGVLSTNWKMVYMDFIRDFIQKKSSVSNYWVGIEKGAVEISYLSSALDDSSKQVVNGFVEQMKNGMSIFTGPLYDNAGTKRCEKDELLSDEILRNGMDWFVDGVFVYEE